MLMSPSKPDLWRILSDTSRIIRAHSCLFLSLSILFIFPISLAGSAIYTLVLYPNPLHIRFLNIFSTADYEIPPLGKSQLLLQLLYSLSTLFFTTCAAASITYTTFHGFYGRPLDFTSALQSILASFLPLLATTLLIQILTALIVFAYMAIILLIYNGFADMDYYHNEYFPVLYIAMAVLLAALLIFLQIEWSVTNAVVVVESDWGVAALRRSSYLVKGARGVVFLMILLFGVLAGVVVIGYLNLAANAEGWSGWLVVKIVVFAAVSTALSLYEVAAITVFFIYCKASSHHELEFKVDDNYVRLPYDVV